METRKERFETITPKRNLKRGFKLDLNEIPLVNGKIHFIRLVNSNGNISVLNELFEVGIEYVGEYVWATIDTGQQILNISYNDENMDTREIKVYEYKID